MLEELTTTSYISELKKLKQPTRNQVRALLEVEAKESLILLNNLRKKKTSSELFQVDRVLRAHGNIAGQWIPELFPKKSQTTENFTRLFTLELTTQLELIELLTKFNQEKIRKFIALNQEICNVIITGNLLLCDDLIADAIKEVGHSHFFLRKALLVRSLKTPNEILPKIEAMLEEAGVGRKNTIVNSIVHCYQGEQEFLSLKRSIMNIQNKGYINKYTRDIARIPFHPHAIDDKDLSEIIYSSLQYSLIDALIIIKINSHLVDQKKYPIISDFFEVLDRSGCSINDIASIYVNKNLEENVFNRHASAWFENNEIVSYRVLQDHFLDSPDAAYIKFTDNLFERVSLWANVQPINNLSGSTQLTQHSHQLLKKLENKGSITRSALFNLCIHLSQGEAKIDENNLFELMGKTCDLSRTIRVDYIKNLAKLNNGMLTGLLCYLLIAKNSKNIADDHYLRGIIQNRVKNHHGGKLIDFIIDLSKKSQIVAEYAYDTCTEDFLAKLPRIITTSTEIIETRAALHQWMGESTGENSFLIRARNLLIDQQINRVRNEIDDHRIYVDSARFGEWLKDEKINEVNVILTSIIHNNAALDGDEPQLRILIANCYLCFCSNNVFGIASYLGRRIRHGTFKGNLYSSVIAIEKLSKHASLIKDANFKQKWEQWKSSYEKKIDNIILDRLHIESNLKRDGFIKTSIDTNIKTEIALACAKKLAQDFIEFKSTQNSIQIITEYCWRLLEVDLKNINSFLKSQKLDLVNLGTLQEIKTSASGQKTEQAADFVRELQQQINEKFLTMHQWFKRPTSVSPKASLSLLYRAVAAEVKESFPHFEPNTELDSTNDIELIGGAYHDIYDSFYVVLYNAAKHGKHGGIIERSFRLAQNLKDNTKSVQVIITSEINENESNEFVSGQIRINPGDDIINAQLCEDRSGIKKLYQLQQSNKCFSILHILCENRKVSVGISYTLEH